MVEKSASMPPRPTAEIELELEGRYRIEAEIGSGGLGAVYRATHVSLDKPVAIKLLHEHFGVNENSRGRFEREAKALASLEHPNIVAVTDYGVAGRTPYLVMELLSGETLAQRLARGPLEPPFATTLAFALLRALAFVHRRGLLHRDVKPGNVFLQESGDGSECLKLLDFGLAKFTADAAAGADTTLTRSGDIMGTPAYMSPEQIASDAVDAPTDVYAVGVILFQMLAGRLPFEGEAADQLRGHLAGRPPLLAEARSDRCGSAALDAVLQRALAKAPKERFADAGEMLAALEAVPQPWTFTRAEPSTPIADSLPFAPTVVSMPALTAAAPAAAPRPSPAATARAATGQGASAWLARAAASLFLVGARLLALVALTVIVIALTAIYLARRGETSSEDMKRMRERVAPRIVQFEDSAKRLARGVLGPSDSHTALPTDAPQAPEVTVSSKPDAAAPAGGHATESKRTPAKAARAAAKRSRR